MDEGTKPLPPQLEPDAIVGRLRAHLTATAQFVAYAHALDASSAGQLQLPGSLIQFGGHGAAEIAPHFAPWMVTVGLRRYIEVFNEFLIEVGVLSAIYRAQLTIPWTFDGPRIAAKIRKMSLPEKLDFIEKHLGHQLPNAVRIDIESINKARVIYEHDAGIVNAAKAKDGDFVVSFRGVDFGYRSGGEVFEIRGLPAAIPNGARVEIRVQERIRRFTRGERLTLSANDFVEIGLSLDHAAAEIIYTFPPYHAQRDARPDPAVPQHFQHTVPPGPWQLPVFLRLY